MGRKGRHRTKIKAVVESLVFVELCGVPGGQVFTSDAGSLQAEVLGLAGDRPVLQINGHTFAGQYEDPVGTLLLLEENEKDSASKKTAPQDQSVSLEYFCKTDKKLVMQPAFLVEKATEPESTAEPCNTDKSSASNPSAAGRNPQKSLMPRSNSGPKRKESK